MTKMRRGTSQPAMHTTSNHFVINLCFGFAVEVSALIYVSVLVCIGGRGGEAGDGAAALTLRGKLSPQFGLSEVMFHAIAARVSQRDCRRMECVGVSFGMIDWGCGIVERPCRT